MIPTSPAWSAVMPDKAVTVTPSGPCAVVMVSGPHQSARLGSIVPSTVIV